MKHTFYAGIVYGSRVYPHCKIYQWFAGFNWELHTIY